MTLTFLRPAGCALLALLASAGVAAPAAAQDQSTEASSWNIPGWTFTPGIIVGALYDTNVAIASPDVNHKTAGDTLLKYEPFGHFEFISARTNFSSGYSGALSRYSDLGDLDGTDHRAYVSLRERLSRRVTIFLNDNYSQAPTTDRLELNDLPFQRTGSRHNALAGGVEARLTKSLDLLTRYEMTWVDFVRQDTALTGGVVNGIRTELTRRLSDRLSAGGEYGFRRADLNQGTRQQLFQDAGGVLHYRTGVHTSVDGSFGVVHLEDQTRALSRTGPYVKVGLTQRAERATFGVNYSRSYVPSLAFGGTNQSQEARGYVQMPLRRNRLYLQESAAWRRTDPFDPAEIALDSLYLNTVVGFAVQRWFRVEGYHAYSTQDNRLAGGQITRHVAGVQFVVSEPVRIR